MHDKRTRANESVNGAAAVAAAPESVHPSYPRVFATFAPTAWCAT